MNLIVLRAGQTVANLSINKSNFLSHAFMGKRKIITKNILRAPAYIGI